MAPVTLFISFLLTNLAVLHSAQEERNYKRCEPNFCNDQIGNLSFPFKYKGQSPECGLYDVDCSEEPARIHFNEGGYGHELTSISESNNILTISVIINKELLERLEKNPCDDESIGNLSLTSPSLAFSVSITPNQTLLKCSNLLPDITPFKDLTLGCSSALHRYYYYNSSNYEHSPRPWCSFVQLPLLTGWNLSNKPSSIDPNFSLQVTVYKKCYDCIAQGDICQVYEGETETTCLTGGGNSKLVLGLGRMNTKLCGPRSAHAPQLLARLAQPQ